MYCSKCGIELDEESLFCNQCGNKVVSDNAIEEEKTLEKESQSTNGDKEILKPIIIIAIICIAGYLLGNGFFKTSENKQQSLYSEVNEVNENDIEVVEETLVSMTEEEKEQSDYNIMYELRQACREASDELAPEDSPELEDYVTYNFLESSDWGRLVLSKMGATSSTDIEEMLLSNSAKHFRIEIYREESGDYTIYLGYMETE